MGKRRRLRRGRSAGTGSRAAQARRAVRRRPLWRRRRPLCGGGGPFGGGGGPFGGGPGGKGFGPDLDRLIAQAQAYIRGLLGNGSGGGFGGGQRSSPASHFSGGRGLALLGLLVAVVWIGSGFYRVQPDEQGVVLRFGAYSYWTPPGLHWHLPWPIETALLPTVTRINRTEIGYRSGASGRVEDGRDAGGRDVLAESLMLTGDENIIDIDVAVFWRVSNASAFLFNTASPDVLVRAVAESSLREVIGRTPIQPALTQARAQIETDMLKQVQEILDTYRAGVEVTQVQLQKVDPPAAVIESFRDVQRANTDAERMRNEADSYKNDIVPRARGDAARIVAEAQGRETGLSRAGHRPDSTVRQCSESVPDVQRGNAAPALPRYHDRRTEPFAAASSRRQAEGPGAVPAAQFAATGATGAAIGANISTPSSSGSVTGSSFGASPGTSAAQPLTAQALGANQ